MKKTGRRNFVRNVSGLALGAAVLPIGCKDGKQGNEDQTKKETKAKTYPQRVLGRTGEKVSLLSLGGYHLGQELVPDETSIEIIRKSIDQGINFLDNANYYYGGRSETLMGRALLDGYREKVLLMTKFNDRTLEGIKKQLETSLERLGMDSFDLMQFHSIGDRDNDVDLIYNNGLLEWAED